MGAEGARQLLRAGANDLGGTLMDENISRAAGAQHGQRMGVEDLEAMWRPWDARWCSARRCTPWPEPHRRA